MHASIRSNGIYQTFLTAAMLQGFTAEVLSGPTAKEVLKKSMEKMKTVEFSAEIHLPHAVTKYYQRTAIDGSLESRVETKPRSNDVQIADDYVITRITNKDGIWDIRPDMVLKMEFMFGLANTLAENSTLPAIGFDDYELSLEPVELDQIPCWKLTAKVPPNIRTEVEKLMMDAVGMDSTYKGFNKETIDNVFPTKTVRYICTTNDFTYRTIKTNSRGKATDDQYYKNVVFEALPDELFQLPAHLPVRHIKSRQEFMSLKPHLPKVIGGKSSNSARYLSLLFLIVLILPLVIYFRRGAHPQN